MKQVLKLLLFLEGIVFFIVSCSFSLTQQNQASIEDIRERYSGEICNSLRGGYFMECEEKCEDIYHRRKDREKCMELEIGLIDDLYETYKLLEEADDLDNIEPDIFHTYISLNLKAIQGLERIIQDYTSGEAKYFLYWLIENKEIADIFRKEDDDHNTLEALFREFHSSYRPAEIWESFIKKIDGDPLMALLINAGEDKVDWFIDFINEKNPYCAEDTETKECFKVYCEIGDRLDEDVRDDWLNYESFQKYINKIIDEKVNSRQGRGDNGNPNGWLHEDAPRNTRDQISDADDLDEGWVEDLCVGGLI